METQRIFKTVFEIHPILTVDQQAPLLFDLPGKNRTR
jgi:hypothetical protein